jgi:hypothetical protein
MNIRSALTQRAHAYRAGGELAAGLGPCEPEVILLFTSVHYLPNYAMLYQGLMDGLPGKPPLVVGCTGDGVYERSGVANHGASALAINTQGKVQWGAALRPALSQNLSASTAACVRESFTHVGGKATFAFVFASGMRTDGSELVNVLNQTITCPYVGGLAADDRHFLHSQVFCNQEARDDAIVMLVAQGELPIALHSASGWIPIGQSGVVESVSGNTIRQINGRPAYTFLQEQLGTTPTELDIGIVPLAEYPPQADGNPVLHAPSHINAQSGDLVTIGGIDTGTHVQVCTATRDDVLRGVDSAIAGIMRAGLTPAGMLVISCAGRRWILEERYREEVDRIQAALGTELPLAGFPSFGEIGPFHAVSGGYTPVYFHNTTCVLCLIGR